MKTSHFLIALAGMGGLVACQNASSPDVGTGTSPTPERTYVMDPHSAARPEEAVIDHLDLDITVDMEGHRISGTAAYDLAPGAGSEVVFDTDGLLIEGVEDAEGNALQHQLGEESFLGRPLRVTLPEGTQRVVVRYATGPRAKALQWLEPAQTGGGTAPFLFTQGQAILTRTWIPVQDSPGIRFTYNATVRVPEHLMAVMSASNPQERSADGVYHFRMDQPIPGYLMALAVGDLAFKPVGPRTGVYAEPGLLDKAAYEFGNMEDMLTAAEDLYGPYRWDRYDVLVLPPSFPFGGMENPRLTFATPTILAGDRSLTSLVAHELAHSWSGNLVTNATWDDFWLNEGFTVYFEHRICEAVFGKDYADQLSLLGHQDLKATVERLRSSEHPEDTRLKLDMAGRDPDDGVTDIAYEKGCAFLTRIEQLVGRPKFDAFLRKYFDTHAFTSMTTEAFLTYLDEELLQPEQVKIDVDKWVYQAGLPDDLVVPASDAFAKVEAELVRWTSGTPAAELDTKGWTTFQWMHFLRHLPDPMTHEQLADLDGAFGFTQAGNSEVVAAWLEQCVRNDYEPAYDRLDDFLTTVGRRKFLVPLYTAMVATEKGKVMANTIYAEARPNYHSVSTHTIDDLLGWQQDVAPISL